MSEGTEGALLGLPETQNELDVRCVEVLLKFRVEGCTIITSILFRILTVKPARIIHLFQNLDANMSLYIIH